MIAVCTGRMRQQLPVTLPLWEVCSKQPWASVGQCAELWAGPGVTETLLGTGLSTSRNRMPGGGGDKGFNAYAACMLQGERKHMNSTMPSLILLRTLIILYCTLYW